MFPLIATVVALALLVPPPITASSWSPADVIRATVQITHVHNNKVMGMCTGVMISASKGQVLTAEHCLPDPESDLELLVDGVSSDVIRKSESLALISIEPFSKPPMKVAEKFVIGEEVVSYGYGYGIMLRLVRAIAAFDDKDIILDGGIVAGMSGGPTVNVRGELVGINQASDAVTALLCGVDEIREFLNAK